MTLYIFGDFLFISIAIFVFLCGCYFIIQRYRRDINIIRELTSDNRIVPVYEIQAAEQAVPSLDI